MAETDGPVVPSLRFSMVVLLVSGGGYSRRGDEADMRAFPRDDKLDNRKELVQYIEQ
jgi:hypothetical protein